ncbi:MAG: dioxygenase, partial [Burkholderiales bacterium]
MRKPTADTTLQRDREITEAVVKMMGKVPDARMREIMVALIRHLHDFARDVNLSMDELLYAADFLTRCGKISDAGRHEFFILADTLGLTMVVDALGNPKPEGAFESSVLGPFYRDGAPDIARDDNLSHRAEDGTPAHVSGRVTDLEGRPIAGALLDIWQSTDDGKYENVDSRQPDMNLRGRLRTDERGEYAFWTVKPGSYPVPDDGPAGELLRACNRLSFRPAHIHFRISAPGFETVTSELYTADDPYIESDAVWGVKESLKVRY